MTAEYQELREVGENMLYKWVVFQNIFVCIVFYT